MLLHVFFLFLLVVPRTIRILVNVQKKERNKETKRNGIYHGETCSEGRRGNPLGARTTLERKEGVIDSNGGAIADDCVGDRFTPGGGS